MRRRKEGRKGIIEETGLKNIPSEAYRPLRRCSPVQFHQWAGLGNNKTPTGEELAKNTTPTNGRTSKPNVGLRPPDELRVVTIKPLSFIMYELQHCRREVEDREQSMTQIVEERQLFIKKPGRLESHVVCSDSP